MGDTALLGSTEDTQATAAQTKGEVSKGCWLRAGSSFWRAEVGQSMPGQGIGKWTGMRSIYTLGQEGGQGSPGAGGGQQGRMEL
eukprot:2676580-Pyramimonas_sp.AAC.1